MLATIDWLPIPESEYDAALGVLRPRLHLSNGFLLGEPYGARECSVTGKTLAIWHAFKMAAGGYFRASEPLTVAEFKAALGRPQ